MTRELIDRVDAVRMVQEAFAEFMADEHNTYREITAASCVTAMAEGRLQTLTKVLMPVDRWTLSERHEGAHECGNCGALALKIGGPYGGEVLTRFCPHCGAELVGTEDEDGGQDSGAL